MSEVPDPEIGDEMTVVVVHPNKSGDRDPVAKVGGKSTYIRFPDKGSSPCDFGDRVRVRIADVQRNNYVAVGLEVLD